MNLDINDRAPEVKAGISGEAYATHDEMMRIFEHFKQENDTRLAQIERRGGDVLADEKVARINAALDAQQRRLDELTLKGARPALEGTRAGAADTLAAREHKAAFESYVRRGESGPLRTLEVKAMSAGSNPDGGYLVPVEIETEIARRLTTVSPIRAIAGVREVSAAPTRSRS